MDVAGAGAAVAKDRNADGGFAGAALGVGKAGDVGNHGAEMADHRQGAVGGVAVVDVAFAGKGGAAGVGKVLVEVFAEVAAPDKVSAEVAVGEGDGVDGLVGKEGEGDGEGFVALTAGAGALDAAFTEDVHDAVVGRAGVIHPCVDAQRGAGVGGGEVVGG